MVDSGRRCAGACDCGGVSLLRKPRLPQGTGTVRTGTAHARSACCSLCACTPPPQAAMLRCSMRSKEELFSLESQKLSGTIDLAEYDQQKAALETVLKRALQRNS